MPHTYDLPGADPLARLSLAELAEIAMQDELVDGLDIREDHVTIHQGERRVSLPTRQASTFLIGMLRGRSWFIDEQRTRGKQYEPAETEREPAQPEPPASSSEHTLESTLNSLLTFAEEYGIVSGFKMDLRGRTVRIDIPACSTELSYVDALAYLIDCMRYEMVMLRREKRRDL